MTKIVLAVDKDNCIEAPGRIPWVDTSAERAVRDTLADSSVVIGRRSAEWLPKIKNDVHMLSKDQDDAFGTLDEALNDANREGVVAVLGGLHVFHQVFHRGLGSELHVFSLPAQFDGRQRLTDEVLADWSLAKEVSGSNYAHQVFVSRDGSDSPFVGRE